MHLLKSRWLTWVGALLLPPVGLVLLWLRRSLPLTTRIAGSFLILFWMVFWMNRVLGLRVDIDGSGSRPLWSFRNTSSHYARLERDRAEQRARPAAPATAPVAARIIPDPQSRPEPAPTIKPTAYWTDFRGPHRDGRYDQGPILTKWPAGGLPLLWREPVGGGYASFVVANGRAFTIEQRRDQEVLSAYDVETGRELWTNGWKADFQESMGGPGPRATPTFHDDRLYVLGAEGEFRALDAQTGKIMWRKNILLENNAENLQWAMAAAPLVVDEKVIVLPGGRDGNSIVAYDRLSGAVIWKSLSDKAAYASPVAMTVGGRLQVVAFTADRVVGLDPSDGRLLWEFPWKTEYDINSAQPLQVAPNRVFLSSGYGHGAAVIELRPEMGRLVVRQVWANNRMKNKFSSSVFHEGHVYGLDESILACVDAATGDLLWKGGRYGYGQLLLASGHLVITTESGEVVLVKATPDRHTEIARFAALQGKTWNHPAIADGRLFVRNTSEMVCFRLTP